MNIVHAYNSKQVMESHEAYETILSNLDKSKQAWIQLLQYNGINYIWQETLDFLLQTEADFSEWNNYWSGSIDNLIADISDYRQYTIEKSHADLTLAEFKRLYRKDARAALERLFIEPISDYVIKKFETVGMDCDLIYELGIDRKVERVHSSWHYGKVI